MQTLTLNISSNKLLTFAGKLNLGNKWDNMVTKIQFVLSDNNLKLGNQYVILENPNNNKTIAIPLLEDLSFYISNGISGEAGEWKLLYLSCSSVLNGDGSIPDDVPVCVSSKISGYIADNYINGSITGVLDENFTILYNNLLTLKSQLEDLITNGIGESGVIMSASDLINQLNSSLDSKINPIITNLNSVITTLNTNTATLSTIGSDIDAIEASITNINTNISTNTTAINTINTNTADIKTDTTNIVTLIGDLQTILNIINN